MHVRWRVGLVLVALLCAGATDSLRTVPPPRPPRFAPPDHGVLFADDFSSGMTAWRTDRPEAWSVDHRMLRADLPDARQLRSLAWAGDSTWTDYALDFDVCMMRGVDKGAVVRCGDDAGLGVDVRGGTYQDVVVYAREWPIGRASVAAPDAAGNHVRNEVVGDRVRVWVNDDLRLDRRQTRFRRGRIALAAYTGGAGLCTVYYDNVVVTAR